LIEGVFQGRTLGALMFTIGKNIIKRYSNVNIGSVLRQKSSVFVLFVAVVMIPGGCATRHAGDQLRQGREYL